MAREKRTINIAGAAGAPQAYRTTALRRFWLVEELLAAAKWLREREVWVVLLAGVAVAALVYQLPYRHRIDVGGNQATRLRGFDKPFIGQGRNMSYGRGFNAEEPDAPDWYELAQAPYRWTEAQATVHVPGIGGGAWLVAVRALPPANRPTLSRWGDGAAQAEIALQPNLEGRPRVYRMLARADANGDLILDFLTPRFEAPGDPRDLGFVMYGIGIATVAGARLPALPQLGVLAALLALGYGGARRAGVARRQALGAGLVAVIGLGLLLARWRLGFTIFAPALLGIATGCYGLMVVLLRLPVFNDRRAATDQPGLAGRHAGVIAGLIVLAFAVRAGGLLHPYAWQSDVGLNANNLALPGAGVVGGQIYFTEALPTRTGGGRAPYPPGQYLVFAPGLLLAPVDFQARQVLLMVGNALWDAAVVGLIWYALRRARAGERAALLGAALYVVPTPMLNRLSTGELANVFGQGLALPLLVALAVAGHHLRDNRHFALGLTLMLLALLGHTGVTLSLALVLICLVPPALLSRGRHLPAGRLLLLGAIGVALVGLFYYSAFVDVMTERLAPGAPAFTSARTPQEKFGGLVGKFGAPTYELTLLMLGLGAVGIATLARRRARGGAGLPLVLMAWWGGTLLSILPLLVRDQTVRWEAFLYPALCLGAGPALSWLWSRGRAGRVAAVVVLAFLVWRGAALWYYQILTYR